jgi:flagellar biosynthesis chaperone FliJ
MTKLKPRVVRALKDARTRLRDVAAAAHSTTAAARDRSARALQDHHASLEAALDDAVGTLAAARTVHELDRIADATGVYRLSVADAIEHHAVATAASETTADRLRERTRQLRTAERLVEIVEHHRARRDARAEQYGADDMAARRR